MRQELEITQWAGDPETAYEIHKTFAQALPLMPAGNQEDAPQLYQQLVMAYPDQVWVARSQGQVVGHIMAMEGPSPQVARAVGAVRPSAQRSGVGRALWDALRGGLTGYPLVRQVQTRTFDSLTYSKRFLCEAGFQVISRLYWFERTLLEPLADEVMEKASRRTTSPFRVIRATEFQALREDWDRAWWEMESLAQRDIPSELGEMIPTFEQWRAWLELPLMDLNRIFIAVEGVQPIGVLQLGPEHQKTVNINLTVVAPTHRRIGVSLALKVEAFEFARSIGAHKISTQNHSLNQAIISSNRAFGFIERDSLIDYLIELS